MGVFDLRHLDLTPVGLCKFECVSWWTFRIFFIFICSGVGKGESGATGRGGVQFFIESPRKGGGGLSHEGRGGGGREGVCRELGGGGG